MRLLIVDDEEAARLRAILSMIAQRFSDPEFNLDSVAGDLGLSRRYIQRLLEDGLARPDVPIAELAWQRAAGERGIRGRRA